MDRSPTRRPGPLQTDRRRPTYCARVVLLREGPDGQEVLVCHHRHPGRAFWCFPGGAVEMGEDFVAAARRELREEAGLDVRPAGICHVLDRPEAGEGGRLEVFLLARWEGDPPQLGADPERAGQEPVLTGLRWVPLAKLGRYRVLPEDLARHLARGAYGVLEL